jgi:hypothetical protein
VSAPRVIEPLSPEEQAAFDLVERVIRRDLPVTTHVQLIPSRGTGFQYAQVLFGDPALRFVAGKSSMAEAFESARAMWRRNR